MNLSLKKEKLVKEKSSTSAKMEGNPCVTSMCRCVMTFKILNIDVHVILIKVEDKVTCAIVLRVVAVL